jgi:hypothetical protein
MLTWLPAREENQLYNKIRNVTLVAIVTTAAAGTLVNLVTNVTVIALGTVVVINVIFVVFAWF